VIYGVIVRVCRGGHDILGARREREGERERERERD